MSIYRIPKQLHADFSRPGVKPKFDVELDLSNSITKNLLLSVEMTEGAGAPRDLVTGRKLSENGQGWGISGGDRETTYSATSDNSVDISGLSDFSGSAHTLHMRVRVSAYDNSGTVIFGWNNNGSHFWQVDDVSTTVFVAGADLGTLKLAHEGATNNYRDWFFVSDPATNETRFYENGVLLNTKNNAVAIPSGSKDIKIGRWAGSNTFSLDGGIKFCRAWNRALTEAERISLLNDPYQILKPKTPQLYFVPISGGGGSSVANNMQISWSALESASNQTQVNWDLLNAVSSSTQIDWDAFQTVVNSSVFQYALVETVSGSTQIDWDLLAALSNVTNSIRLDWAALEAISSQFQIDWSLLVNASNSVELRHNLLNQIGQTLGIQWHSLAGVNNSIQIDWDTLSNLSSVSNSVQAVWSMAGKINAQISAQWHLLESVGVSKELQWDLATEVAQQVQANWDLLQSANKEVQLVWNSAGSTSQGLQLNWTLQTDSVRIPLHVMVIKKQNRIMKILH